MGIIAVLIIVFYFFGLKSIVFGAQIATEPEFKVAFIGDSNKGKYQVAVLKLIKQEGADLVLHQGDFAYSYNVPDMQIWMNNINNELGPAFPYLGSVGNHDDWEWGDMRQPCPNTGANIFDKYATFFRCRLSNMGMTPTVGQFAHPETDDSPQAKVIYPTYSTDYKGLKMVFIGEKAGFDDAYNHYEEFIRQELTNDNHIWKICSMHKQTTNFQLGGKSDAMGLGVLETCRELGAIIATGHEHSYQRTKTMTNLQNLSVDTVQHPLQSYNGIPNVPSNPNNLLVSPGKTFLFVSGNGGASLRVQQRCLPASYPYGGGPGCNYIWANAYTLDQGATFGALFITFNYNGDPNRAHGYFKNINGNIIDEFDIYAKEGSVTPGVTSTIKPTNAPLPTSTPLPKPTATSSLPKPTSVPTETTSQIIYAASNEDFANPDRGFMRQTSIWPDQTGSLSGISRNNPADSLVWVYFRLDNFRNKDLDAAALSRIKSVFATARSQKLKLVIRFVYNSGPGSSTDKSKMNPDAPIDLVLKHIAQLKPIINENADVITALQTGFAGHWGEWHSSYYDLNSAVNGKKIIDALLDALPNDRMLQLRYPRDKYLNYQGPLTQTQAFSGTDASRIGHHNDCFLRDTDDTTYNSKTVNYCKGTSEIACWKEYVSQEGSFTPIGGETCQYNPPRTDCQNAQQELKMLHWSFLNNGYRKEVLDGWVAGGCMDTIRRNLGYRFVLKKAIVPSSAAVGQKMTLEVNLANVGYASLYNPHPVYLVLKGEGQKYEIPLPNVDPRRWEAGQEYTFPVSVTLPPNITPGSYSLELWLPDSYISLKNIPEYAIRFANVSVWDASNGTNILKSNFQVTKSTGGTLIPTSPTIPTKLAGDGNNDGSVDETDFSIWLNHYNQSTSNGALDGDFDGNGLVDGIDYVIWRNNFGK